MDTSKAIEPCWLCKPPTVPCDEFCLLPELPAEDYLNAFYRDGGLPPMRFSKPEPPGL